MGLDVGVPVLLPAVALPTHLALERLQAHVFVHVLLQIFGFIEPLITAAGGTKKRMSTPLSMNDWNCASLKRDETH